MLKIVKLYIMIMSISLNKYNNLIIIFRNFIKRLQNLYKAFGILKLDIFWNLARLEEDYFIFLFFNVHPKVN